MLLALALVLSVAATTAALTAEEAPEAAAAVAEASPSEAAAIGAASPSEAEALAAAQDDDEGRSDDDAPPCAGLKGRVRAECNAANRGPGGGSGSRQNRASASASAGSESEDQDEDRSDSEDQDGSGGAPSTGASSSTSSSSSPSSASSSSSSSSAGRTPSPEPTPVAPAPAPSPGGIRWGSSVMPYGGESYAQALSRVQGQLRPEIIRYFNPGAPSWPSKTGSAPLVISFKLPPREVVAGTWDARLAAFFAATPRQTYWSYWHEPEDEVARGAFTAAQYRAAWSRIASIADASGRPLRATLILMDWTVRPASGRTWTDFYPGADVIDVLAWDAYAWSPGATPSGIFDAVRRVSQRAGKPWAIAETGAGSVQFTPAAKQSLLTSMAKYLATAQPQPEFVTYFDSDPDAPNIEFGWNISRTPASAAAWRQGQSG